MKAAGRSCRKVFVFVSPAVLLSACLPPARRGLHRDMAWKLRRPVTGMCRISAGESMATGDMTSVLPTEWREGMMLLSVRFRLLPAATSVSFREICIQRSSADHREIAPPGNIMTQDTADIRDRLRAEMPTADTRDRLPAEISSAGGYSDPGYGGYPGSGYDVYPGDVPPGESSVPEGFERGYAGDISVRRDSRYDEPAVKPKLKSSMGPWDLLPQKERERLSPRRRNRISGRAETCKKKVYVRADVFCPQKVDKVFSFVL